ncbi:kelch motif domain-containing protein, putative [Eimeria maxima]|uniref:Kelch motif domain-containing protein, putative n=1 Tax=Eimeria maxima TaxID=5804 RepID=U6M887_EIMMA|nr:kelch motif domain-containing protein, putative [Eimeria maxima]CDJ57885.1 kelch motif domain-containing protein, putative [Eimeria maxima]
MVSDLRRTFVSWLRHTEAELKRERNDLVRRKREFEEEKKKVWALFQQDKEAEYNKIKEERRAAHAELQQQLKQLEIERNDARGKLQKEKQKFIQEQENARRKQVLERERFRQEVLAFESLNQRVMDATIAAEMVIDINVGGVIYESSRETLIQQKKSLLSSILSGKFPVPRDKQGRIFFDRDAELFRIILNFLRQPNTPPQPRDSAESDALCAEAAFYGLNFFSSPLVFALGGNDGKKHLDTIEYYNYKQQRWIYCPPMQTERAYASAAAIHNKIYLCGGQNINYKALCDVEVYDALLGSWFSCQPLSIPRRNACASSLNKRVFIIGGFNGESILSSVEGLDTRMKNWIHLAPLNSPRSSAMCCAHGDSLVVLGGTTGERLRTVEVYDERMDKWETLPASMIEVRSAGSAVSGNNHLYVLGGIDSEHRIINSIEGLDPDGFGEGERERVVTGGQDGEVLNSVCFYDPEGDQWSTGPPMLSPRYGHCLVVTNL